MQNFALEVDLSKALHFWSAGHTHVDWCGCCCLGQQHRVAAAILSAANMLAAICLHSRGRQTLWTTISRNYGEMVVRRAWWNR